jgi:RNA polymerase sigma-70 factor (ECF subfamily)
MPDPDLVGPFRDHPRRADLTDAELDALVRERITFAERSWPGFTVERARFSAVLAARVVTDVPLADGLAALHADDLYLACACADGVEAAVAEFDRRYLTKLHGSVARLSTEPAFVDELRQILRNKLLVAISGPPKIGDYSGRGKLEAWVRAAAVRTALDLLERDARHAPLDTGRQRRLGSPDPELDYIKARYRGEFERAFQAALATLTVEQRNVMRLHYLDGLSLQQIGKLQKVHTSTISRWLSTTREELFAATRRALCERLQLETQELESLMGLVQSRVEISLHALLADE